MTIWRIAMLAYDSGFHDGQEASMMRRFNGDIS
jgi:hypothetical protein